MVGAHDFQILVGWELLYLMPESAYILGTSNLQWLMQSFLKTMMLEAVVCSDSKTIFTLAADVDIENFACRAAQLHM